MTDQPLSSSPRYVLPTARRSAVRRAPATAGGVLAAVALGAGVLLLPVGAPDTADALVTETAVQHVAHPTPAEPQPEVPAQPVAAVQVRDPFQPLVRDAGPDTSAPAQGTTVSVPAGGTTTVVDEVLPPPPPPVSLPASPTVPTDGAAGPGQSRELTLVSVEATGDSFVAVLAFDGERLRASVGDSFGPRADLLLLSLQQGPGDGQWTAVVQVGQGEPFDLVTGAATRIP